MQNKNLNSFEKTNVRWGLFKIFSSQNYNRRTKVVLAANAPACNHSEGLKFMKLFQVSLNYINPEVWFKLQPTHYGYTLLGFRRERLAMNANRYE